MICKIINLMRFHELIMIVLLAGNYLCYSQYSTEKFNQIIHDSSISDSVKEKKLEELLEQHYHNKTFDTLFNDTFMVMRWYNNKNEFNKAIPLNRRNIFLMDSIGYKNQKLYRLNFFSLGICLEKQNQFDEALNYFLKVLEYNIDDRAMILSNQKIGQYFFFKNDYYQAIEYFENSIERGIEIDYITYVTDAVLYSAISYRLINTKESIHKSIDLLENEISRIKNSFDEETTYMPAYLSSLSSLHKHLGNAYADKKDRDFNKAIFNLNKALAYTEKILGSSKGLRLSGVYHDIGNLYAHENDPIALVYFDMSLRNRPDTILISQLYDNKGNFYKRQKQFKKAKANIQTALKILSPKISEDYDYHNTEEYFFNSQDKHLTVTFLINKAEIYIEEANYTNSVELNRNAIKILETTDKLVDIVRFDSNEFKTKLFWRNLSSRLYTNAIKACFALKDYERAFYFMEKNKALLLLEDVLLESQRNSADIPEEVTKTHDQLRKEVLKYDSAHDSMLRYKLIAKAKYNNFIDSLDIEYKLYFKSIKPAEVISLDSFQTRIKDPKQAYLEYILGEDEGFGMLTTKNDVQLFVIPNADTLRTQVSALKALLKTPITNKSMKEEYNNLSYSIYSELFPEKIRGAIKGKSLTIIPDDILFSIPFEALQPSTSDNDYLIYSHQISYANSLIFLSKNTIQTTENTKNAIGFAPIHFNSGLPPLEHSKPELEQLNLFMDAELLIEEKASKQNLVNNLNDYKVIHISTHASSDKFREPYLALSDSLVNINELYLTKNKADLVVLSACETANGELFKGEGVLSLSRSFFNTGARSVASTLWSIDDKSSSEIMASFYNNLNEGQSKAKALHKAKLDYLNTHSLSEASPYYWASFVLVGDTRPINFHQDYTIYYVILGLTLILVANFFIWKRKQNTLRKH